MSRYNRFTVSLIGAERTIYAQAMASKDEGPEGPIHKCRCITFRYSNLAPESALGAHARRDAEDRVASRFHSSRKQRDKRLHVADHVSTEVWEMADAAEDDHEAEAGRPRVFSFDRDIYDAGVPVEPHQHPVVIAFDRR